MYILTFLHGSGNLLQRSFFYYFFLGPGILFALDKLVSISRKKVDIAVVKAELLPSGEEYFEADINKDDADKHMMLCKGEIVLFH